MSRAEIQLTNQDFWDELTEEIRLRTRQYPDRVQAGEMSTYEANRRWLVMIELKEFIDLLNAREMELSDLVEILKAAKTIMAVQMKLSFH